MNLPRGYVARSATSLDLDAVVEVFAAYDLAIVGEVEPRREFLQEIWSLPYVSFPQDTLVIECGERIVAYAHTMWNPLEGGRQFGVGRVVPGYEGRGLGTAVLAWMEDRAVDRGCPDDVPVDVRTSIVGLDEGATALVVARGYQLVRRGVDMGMRLEGDERPTAPPEGVEFSSFVTGRDEGTVFALHRETFADHWGRFPTTIGSFAQEWWDAPTWDPGLVVIARLGDEAIGFVASIVLSGGGYVTSLGVREPFRGRGVATALMRRTIADLAARGCLDVFLSADPSNATGAPALYAGLGMTVRREIHVYDGPTEHEPPPGRTRSA